MSLENLEYAYGERIEIKIRPKHFRNATEFGDNEYCPLALAIADHFKLNIGSNFGEDEISVLYYDCEINNLYFEIEDGWIWNTPGILNNNKDTVDDLIKRAKQKKKVGTYTVTLIKK